MINYLTKAINNSNNRNISIIFRPPNWKVACHKDLLTFSKDSCIIEDTRTLGECSTHQNVTKN